MNITDFEVLDEIGRGAFGVVRKAKWKETNQLVAIKTINWKFDKERLEFEVQSLRECQHDHIVKFFGHFVNKETNETCLVLEFCSMGSLRQYVKDNGTLTAQQAASVMRQLVRVVMFLHSKHILHRDLSSSNILISRIRKNGNLSIKLCDFGLAKGDTQRGLHTMVGTPGYIAPQVKNQQEYGPDADVYSIGCLLYFMLTGTDPKANGQFPMLNKLCPSAQDLVTHMTHPDARRRMKLNAVLKSEFANEFIERDESVERRSGSNSYLRPVPARDLRSFEDKPPMSGHRMRSQSAPRQIHPIVPESIAKRDSRERSRDRKAVPWPLNLNRLAMKTDNTADTTLYISDESNCTFTHTRNGVTATVSIEDRHQTIVFASAHGDETYTSYYELPVQERRYYQMIIESLDRISAKVCKLAFNDIKVFPGGVAKLMENGDVIARYPNGRKCLIKQSNPSRVLDISSAGSERDVHPESTDGIFMQDLRYMLTTMEAALKRFRRPLFPFAMQGVSEGTQAVRVPLATSSANNRGDPVKVDSARTSSRVSATKIDTGRISRQTRPDSENDAPEDLYRRLEQRPSRPGRPPETGQRPPSLDRPSTSSRNAYSDLTDQQQRRARLGSSVQPVSRETTHVSAPDMGHADLAFLVKNREPYGIIDNKSRRKVRLSSDMKHLVLSTSGVELPRIPFTRDMAQIPADFRYLIKGLFLKRDKFLRTQGKAEDVVR